VGDRTDLAKLGVGHRHRFVLDDGSELTGTLEHVDSEGTALVRHDDGSMSALACEGVATFTLLDRRVP